MASAPLARLPIGVSDFRKLREPGILYVDKTDFVARVLESRAEVLLFPRPRRFGKTVNLSTLRCYVEKSSEDVTPLFAGLSVSGAAAARPHFQRHPVIALTFKDIKDGSFDAAFAAIRREIRRAYREHAYLLDEGALRPEDAAAFQQILRAEGAQDLYAESLRELSLHLARYHGERVVILVDEYDTPIHASAAADERPLLAFLRAFFSGGLKDNPHLFKGVLTGVLRIGKESLFSGLNNLAVYSLLRPEHATSFGFTEPEVRDLAAHTGCTASLADLERWYDGYRFGGHVIYNPWSVLNFLDSEDKELRPYWVQTSSNDLLRRVVFAEGVGQGGELEDLIQGGEIDKPVDESVALRDLGRQPEAVWSFLLFSGYLTARAVREEGGRTHATLAIPNQEVLFTYRTLFRSWLEQGLGGAGQVEELLGAVLSGRADACERLLGQLLQSLSVHDLAGRRAAKKRGEGAGGEAEGDVVLTPEQVYHVFVVSLLLGLEPRYAVRSNRESGGGRYDVMVLPRAPGQPGVVLELKVRNRRRRETAKGAMAAALRQIRERDYAAELRSAGAEPIHEMGIVFDGKQVRVEAAPAR
jgi:hypothetical protein